MGDANLNYFKASVKNLEDMEQLTLNISEKSRTRIIASSPLSFQIELME